MNKTLYVIDGHAHIYAAYFAPMSQRLSSPSGEPTKAVYIFTTTLLGMIGRKRPDMVVVAMDTKTPSVRTAIYPEYKAHRPPMPDDLPGQIIMIEQILAAMKIPLLRVDGYEADDIIGTLACKAPAMGIDVLICSKDKDMLQLLGDHVSKYDIKNDQMFTAEDMQREMQVTPSQFLDALALQGDKVDNVPGVPDVGPKTALQWIQQYGNIENLFEHADEIKGKRGDSLRNSRQAVELSKRLVTIDCEAPVEVDPEEFALKDFDKPRLGELFTQLGFSRLFAQLDLTPPPAQGDLFVPAEAGEPEHPVPTAHASIAETPHTYRLVDTQEKFGEFVDLLAAQPQFAIAVETDSPSAMRGGLVGVSLSWKPHEAFYLPLKGPMGGRTLNLDMVREKLAPLFADAARKKVGHDMKFASIVLANAGMPLGGVHFDTMVASYVLDAARQNNSIEAMALDLLGYRAVPASDLVGTGRKQTTLDTVETSAACDYSAEKADVVWRLHEILERRLEHEPQLQKLFRDVEMPLLSVLADMEQAGVSINVGILKTLSNRFCEDMDRCAASIFEKAGVRFNIDSPKQLSEVLFDRLGLISLRNGKAGRSTDADVLDQLQDAHPIIADILEYRQLSKLRNTYVDKLPTLIHPRTNRIHASFNQTVTTTGRLSSSDPNLQNIPIRTELGRSIREAFVPANKGDVLLSADYSQIELRMLAHFSQDAALIEAFRQDRDIHRFVASQLFGVPIDEVTPEQRSRCKTVNFGIIYGQGPFGLAKTTGMSQSEAKHFIEEYFRRYRSIRAFIDKTVEDARTKGYAETILHRRRTITGLDSRNFNVRSQAERLAFNTVLQGSAADLIKVAMVSINRRIRDDNLRAKLILQIHDELVFELPAKEAQLHCDWISQEMTSAIALNVPLKVDATIGLNWSK